MNNLPLHLSLYLYLDLFFICHFINIYSFISFYIFSTLYLVGEETDIWNSAKNNDSDKFKIICNFISNNFNDEANNSDSYIPNGIGMYK